MRIRHHTDRIFRVSRCRFLNQRDICGPNRLYTIFIIALAARSVTNADCDQHTLLPKFRNAGCTSSPLHKTNELISFYSLESRYCVAFRPCNLFASIRIAISSGISFFKECEALYQKLFCLMQQKNI
jgi:hypothetical protein